MSLKDLIPSMLREWEAHQQSLQYKKDLFCIKEGDLFRFIDEELRRTFGQESKAYAYARERIPPINLLQKIVDKLSQIYNNPPSREVIGTPQDEELFDWYTEELDINTKMDVANENYNLTKVSLIMPAFDPMTGEIALNVRPSHQFLPFGDNPIFPQRMTRLMTYQGEKRNTKGATVKLFYAYTDQEFIAFTSDEMIDNAVMEQLGNDGVNLYGKIPAVYTQRSRTLLYPLDDTDTKRMTTLVPVLLSDLNLASMFSAFSIIYGIDLNDENLKYAPNAFWSLKSDPASDKKPELGTIKNEADIDKTLNLIATELGLWLNTKGIRPGAVGQLDSDNFISGISKMIDEMDAFEDRKKQANEFKRVEERGLWELIMHYMHPVWVSQGLPTNQLFSSTAKVRVNFPSQEMLKPRSEKVANLKAEMDAGFISRRMAVKELNPDLTDEDIDELMGEIDGLAMVEIPDNESDIGMGIVSQQTIGDISKETLNGAQVSSLVEIVEKIASGILPRDSGVNMIMRAFNLDSASADQIVGSAGKSFKIAKEDVGL